MSQDRPVDKFREDGQTPPETTVPLKLLLVEDNAADADLLQVLLAKAAGGKFALTAVARMDKALQAIASQTFDAVILDLTLPDADGMTTWERVQQASPQLPVLIFSGFNDEKVALQLLQRGIQDYLVKGQADGPAVWRALLYAIERKRMQRGLAQLAQYDALTGLPNRALLCDRLAQAIVRTKRSKRSLAVMFLDLDRFKTINDSFGHAAGDRLLVAATQQLSGCLRHEDTVARFAGDEFVVVLEGIAEDWHAGVVAEKILRAFGAPLLVDGHDMYTPCSIGIALFPRDGRDVDALLRNADAAMYQVKAKGGNAARFYESHMNERSYGRLTLQNALRRAIERDELRLHYQPIFALRSGHIVGFEALLRWQHPTRGLLLPADFVGHMEETGVILPAGEWVLRTVCADYQAWRAAGLPRLRMKVNMSARQLSHPGARALVENVLRQAAMDPRCLTLELTEEAFMKNTGTSDQTLKQLRDLGVNFSIDDFGTGCSSLSYLKRLSVDTLKIDRSFVAGVPRNPDGVNMVNAIIGLAHNLHLKVTAEGVETPEQLAFLEANGCDEAQGFLLGRPLPAAEVLAFVAGHADCAIVNRAAPG